MAIRPNLIITGFMGTGKTTVGRVVAERLGREFFDMDEAIEERLGMTIPEIFARHGEGFFREKEREIVEELAASSGKVVSTGGGTLVSEVNRTLMAQSGIIVNLSCSLEEIASRLEDEHDRPLIEGEERLSAFRRLLDERQEQYAKISWQIDTTSFSVENVADQIIAGYLRADSLADDEAAPERVAVDWPYGSHEVIFGVGLIDRIGRILRQNGLGGPVALVAPGLVRELYAGQIDDSLRQVGFAVQHIEVPDGERHKNLDTVSYLYDRFIDAGIDRSSTVATLGGGVVSDTVGYAAATFMRGVPLVHIPTTLLAQVDASIGGKVGVDHARGKNIIGAFYAPRLVVIDPLVLRSLPDDEVRTGSAEVVKTAMIGSAELFARLERSAGEITFDEIKECVRIKAGVVSRDPFEKGERAILNFGHTVGHAIEVASGYHIRHGDAISIGMMAATRIAVEMGLCDGSVEERLGMVLVRLSLPVKARDLQCPLAASTTPSLDALKVRQAMEADKKKRDGKLRYVLPTGIGSVVVSAEVPEEIVHRALDWVL